MPCHVFIFLIYLLEYHAFYIYGKIANLPGNFYCVVQNILGHITGSPTFTEFHHRDDPQDERSNTLAASPPCGGIKTSQDNQATVARPSHHQDTAAFVNMYHFHTPHKPLHTIIEFNDCLSPFVCVMLFPLQSTNIVNTFPVIYLRYYNFSQHKNFQTNKRRA